MTSVVAIAALANSTARAQSGPWAVEAPSTTSLIIRFEDDCSDASRDVAHADAGTTLVRRMCHLDGMDVVSIPEGASIEECMLCYSGDPNVRYVSRDLFGQPTGRVSLTEPGPWMAAPAAAPAASPGRAFNDPMLPLQWPLENTGSNLVPFQSWFDPYLDSSYRSLFPGMTMAGQPDLDLNADQAWNITMGDPEVVIAIIDEGWWQAVWDFAPEKAQALEQSFWINSQEIPGDGIDNDENGYVDDVIGINAVTGSGDPFGPNSHGTLVAGFPIGSPANDGLDGVGVAPDCSLLACNVVLPNGQWLLSGVLASIDYLIDLTQRPVDPVRIAAVNMSFAFNTSVPLVEAYEGLRDAGILAVKSAGNFGADLDIGGPPENAVSNSTNRFLDAQMTPINFLTVGGHIFNSAAPWVRDTPTHFASEVGDHSVDLLAPSDFVPLWQWPGDVPLDPDAGQGPSWVLGTSVAGPLAAGVVGLVAAAYPELEWYEIRNRLIAGAKPDPAARDSCVSGGYLRAADVDDGSGIVAGALTCENAIVTRRLTPEEWSVIPGVRRGSRPVKLQVLNINGGEPNGPVQVRVFKDGKERSQLDLRDDGTKGDLIAGDGIYTYDFVPGINNAYDLHFPDHTGRPDVVHFEAYNPKDYLVEVLDSFEWREPGPDDQLRSDGLPWNSFGVWIGTLADDLYGATRVGGTPSGYRQYHWSENGTVLLGYNTDLSFTAFNFTNLEFPLPFSDVYPQKFLNIQVMLAPFWDGLASFSNSSGPVSTSTTFIRGTAPNREFVWTFEDLTHASLLSSIDREYPGEATVTLQAVTREADGSVLYNYKDVVFGDSRFDYGASATVGIQVTDKHYVTYSHNTPVLANNMSLLLTPKGE